MDGAALKTGTGSTEQSATPPSPGGKTLSWLQPSIRLHGDIDDDLRRSFYEQLEAAPADEPLVVEVFTRGGDADIGRLLACEIKLQRQYGGRQTIFLGRSTVYSAGVTIMSAFEKKTRFLSRDAALMVHGRQLEKTLNVSGAIRTSIEDVRSLLAQMEKAIELERQDFRDLAEGSTMTGEQIWECCASNWYLTGEDALRLGLVEGLF